MSVLADAALGYAAVGIPVLPLHHNRDGECSSGAGDDCPSPAKHPRNRDGLTSASCDADTVEEWWQRWPHANIGVRTGVAFDVLDIDGTEGRFAFNAWLDGRIMPRGPVSRTQSGGWHVLVQPTGAGNRARMLVHVDWRGRGGYIVAPPSVGIKGPYRWFDGPGLDAIPEPPGWLRDLADPPRPPVRPLRPMSSDGRSAYGLAALKRTLEELITTPQGARNAALNAAAYSLGRLVGAEILDPGPVTEALLDAGEAIGLGPREVVLTVDSGLRGGIKNPRYVEERKAR